MKILKSFSFTLLAAVCISACSSPDKVPDQPKELLEVISDGDPDDGMHLPTKLDSMVCLYDTIVSIETVNRWKATWDATLEQLSGAPVPDGSQQRKISAMEVQELIDMCLDCTGLRAYFAMSKPGDKFPLTPHLLLVNTFECEDYTGKIGVTVHPKEGDPVIVDPEGYYPLAHHWQAMIDNPNAGSTGLQLSKVYAYNFEIAYLTEFLTNCPGDDIVFRFGMRPENASDLNSPLQACLILECDPQPIHPEYVDFALPCPKNCDNGSPFLQNN